MESTVILVQSAYAESSSWTRSWTGYWLKVIV